MNPQRPFFDNNKGGNFAGLAKYQSGNTSSQKRKNSINNNPTLPTSEFNAQQSRKKPSPDVLSKYSKDIRQKNQSNNILKKYSTYQKKSNLQRSQNKINAQIAKNQYKKFISDTENIFYQNRKQLKFIQKLKKSLSYIVPVYVILLIIIIFIIPLSPVQNCPPNSECGIYIYCNNGFILNDKGMCQTDPSLKMEAQYLIQIISQNLQYKYGSQECNSNQIVLIRPQMSFSNIKQNYSINIQVLQKQMLNKLKDSEIQQKYGFYFDTANMILTPTIKQYNFNCRMQKKFSEPIFLLILGSIFIFIIGIIALIKKIKRYYLGKNIYYKLKQICQSQKTILVKQKLLQIEKIPVSQKLWLVIDNQRRKDQKIIFYEDFSHLYWKWIQ